MTTGTEERLTDEAPKRRRRVAAAAPDDRGLGERGMDARTDLQDGRNDEALDDQVLATFMESLDQSVLPDLPKIPGYHLCWLTTTNLRDTPAYRERIGYTPLRRSELRDWNVPNLKTAEGGDDLVRVNEMVAYKIPERLYQRYMQELHHNRPLAEEEKLRAKTEAAKQNLEAMGSRVTEEGDGTAEIVQRPRKAPAFAD